jgi:hypothetical protein
MERTRMKNVEFLQYGANKLIEVAYHSPFPEEFHGRILYVCPFCLYYFTKKFELEVHSEICTVRCPPGDEIYRDHNFSIFEVDARKEKQYSLNLCYISNCYLDHKYLNVDISLFNFYVLCERNRDKHGLFMCGYFSKVRN